MKEVYDLLKDAAGYTDKEIEEKFVITENPKEYVIKAIDYLDSATFKAVAQAVGEKGGGYIPGKTATFTIPKTPSEHGVDSEPVNKELRNEIQTIPISALSPMTFKARVKPEFELDELVESIKTYGILEPILVRRKGELYEIVAGERRVKAAKTAGLTEVPVIVKNLSDVDAFVIQLSENLQRKDLSEEEKSMALAELAKRTGWKAQQIADKIKMSYRWVCLYLPQDFKDKEMAELGRKGGEAKAEQEAVITGSEIKQPAASLAPNLKPQDTFVSTPAFARTQQEMAQQAIDCEVCGKPMDRSRGTIVGGKIVCPKCAGKDKPLTVRKLEAEPAFKPKETADFRVAQMHPKVSKMDTAMLIRLQNNEELKKLGWRVEFQKPRTKIICISDVTLIDRFGKEIDVYFDYTETHKDSQVEDDFARQEAARIHKIEVIPLLYDAVTETEECRLEKTIVEQLKNRGSF
jgi:ParB/RepB/Spo0J family partition protein